jgi:DNA modification methylase
VCEFVVIATFKKNSSEAQFQSYFNWRDNEERGNVWKFPSIPAAKRRNIHEEGSTSLANVNKCQKPIRMLRKVVEHFSVRGDNVLDLCSGTNSTAIACALSNRNCVSIEMNEFQYKQGKLRVEQLEQALAECTDDELDVTTIEDQEF